MFRFSDNYLQGSQNKRSRRRGWRLFGTVKVDILALVTITSLFINAAVIHAQQLFVSSFNNSLVLTYDGTTGAFIDTLVAEGLPLPTGLVFGPDGNLYIADISFDVVEQYNFEAMQLFEFVMAGSGGLNRPIGLVFGPDGNLYVSSEGADQVLRYNGTTGEFMDVFVPAGSGGLIYPQGLVFGSDGNLYVSSNSTEGAEVLRYDGTSGAFMNAFVSAGSGGLEDPEGLVFDNDGNLCVRSSKTNEVLRYDGLTGAFIDAFVTAGSGGLDGPAFLVFSEPPGPSDMEGKGGGCSVASAGAPVSAPLYLLVPALFVIIRRVLRALRG